MEADLSFQVFVCVFTDEVITLDVNPSTTIEKVLSDVDNNGFEDHLLLFRGQNLLDDRFTTLDDWGIKGHDQLILSRKGVFDVTVHDRSGHRPLITIKVDTLETVFQTKKKIWEVTRLPIVDQVLHYCNNPMDDDNATLATYGIFNPGDQADSYVLDLYIAGFDEPALTRAARSISWHLKQLSPAEGSYTIFIEIAADFSPDFAGTLSTFVLHLAVKGNDTMDVVKKKICDRVYSHKSGSPLKYILDGLFVLLLKRLVMVDAWTVDECGIKDRDTLVLCRKQDFLITAVVVVAGEVQVHGVSVCSFDRVMKLKSSIKEVAGISAEKQIVLRYEDNWLADEHMCLFEYGIVELNRARGTAIVEAVEYDAGRPEMQLD